MSKTKDYVRLDISLAQNGCVVEVGGNPSRDMVCERFVSQSDSHDDLLDLLKVIIGDRLA
jgi:hypothetical protein